MDSKIIEFLLLQNQLTQVRKINSFYRGDNLENLYKRFGIIHDRTIENQKELLIRIFLIGDKSKYFYEEELFGAERFSRDMELTDESEIVLDKIFKKLNSVTKSNKEYIQNYFNKNKTLL